MERTSVNLETLRDIPGYRVILKTVLHSQIQQLVEQLSKHTEEEVVFLTASLGDGTISHIGSSVGKEFLQKNDEVKSKFLAFCLKRHHEISTSQLSKQPKSQGQGPVPVKLTGRPVTPRHSPYANSSARHRNSKRQSRSTTSGQSNSGADESTASENDRKILESVSIELADADDNDYTEEFDVTDNEGLSDLDEGQKWDEITSETTTGKVHPIEGADAVQESAAEVESFHNYDNTNSDVGLDISQNFTGNIDTESVISVKVESVHTDTGDALQLGVGLDSPSISGLAPSSQSVSGASGSYTALQDDGKKNNLSSYPKEIRFRKKKGEIPVYANITPTQTKCPYCDRNYANNANLKRHIRQHEGIYPYKCEACLQKFTDPTIYKRHVTNIKKPCFQFYSKHIEDFAF